MMNEETGNLEMIEEEAKPNQGFSKGSESTQTLEPMYLDYATIDILFHTIEV
jgi:hypothetical protein